MIEISTKNDSYNLYIHTHTQNKEKEMKSIAISLKKLETAKQSSLIIRKRCRCDSVTAANNVLKRPIRNKTRTIKKHHNDDDDVKIP